MPKLQTAVIGTGFVGRVHVEAIRRLGDVDLTAIADRDDDLAHKFAQQLGVDRAFGDFRRVLDDKAIAAVHICVPNALHYEIAKAAIQAGKAVLCEKPLAATVAQAAELVELATRAKVIHTTCYNLRYYPLVQHMRRLVATGEIGEILAVQGTYSQDWLFYETDYNWRLEPEAGGKSRAMADIGSHWCDMVEYVTGCRITSLCAELQTFHPIRKKPKKPIETYAGKLLQPEDYADVSIQTEDFGAILLRLGDRARGALTINQVAAGRKNLLRLEIYGTRRGMAWEGENPNQLWIGRRDGNNEIVVKDPSLLEAQARAFADLPGGHAEGYGDTFKQLFRRFYAAVRNPAAPADLPTFQSGLRQLHLVDAVLDSSAKKSWVTTS